MSGRVLELDDGRRIETDEKGYLLNQDDWDTGVAEHMAREDELVLTDDHHALLAIFRRYFEEFEIEPPMRALVKICAAELGAEKGNSRYLYQLFPQGPTTQASRYAGLPRPLSCI